jgi:hypothetical protein
VRPIEIKTRRAADVFEELGLGEAHLVKLDTQGAEIEILKGFGEDLLKSMLAVELEASLQHKGVNYPIFTDVDGFMREQGFELYGIRPVHVHRSFRGRRAEYLEGDLGVDVRSASVAGRAWEVDALYLRPPESVHCRARPESIRRLVVCFCLYKLFTEALHAIRLAADDGLLDAPRSDEMRSAVIDWHRSTSYRWWRGKGLAGRAFRTITRLFQRELPYIQGALE